SADANGSVRRGVVRAVLGRHPLSMRELRALCAAVAERARSVLIDRTVIPAYAASLPLDAPSIDPDPETQLLAARAEHLAAFWLTLDAINFGSGWFPTLRKRPGRSGYSTVAFGIRERFDRAGPWSAAELGRIEPPEIAEGLGQDPRHELMQLFALSLRDL